MSESGKNNSGYSFARSATLTAAWIRVSNDPYRKFFYSGLWREENSWDESSLQGGMKETAK